jgi:hypothetical protein
MSDGNLQKQFEQFVNRFREIVRIDAKMRFDYFVDLEAWLRDTPRGTAATLSEALGYNKFWASNNIRPIRAFGVEKCKHLLFELGWPWSDIVMLSGAEESRRDDLVARAAAGEDRKTVINAVFETFQGNRGQRRAMRDSFFDAVSEATPSQIIRWLTEYLSECPKARATSILKGLAVLSMKFAPRRMRREEVRA